MDTTPPEPGTRREPSRILLSPTGTVLLAIALGLCGGYLDLIVMTFKKYYLNELRYFWSGSDFPWSVPVVHAVLLAIAGVLVAVVNRVRPGRPMTLRAGAWLFATLAIWAALLRMPLYGVCSLLLAAGLGRPISAAVAACSRRPRQARYALAGLLGLLIVLAALSSGRQAVRKYRAASTLPAPPVGRPQRRPDRLGHRPRPQLEPLWLSTRHHPQPPEVGANGGAVRHGPGASPLDVPLA